MPWKRTILLALPTLALALSGCAKTFEPEAPLAVRPTQSQCPAYPLPAQELLQRPRILDFLPGQSSSSEISSRPNKLFSSTR